MNKEEKLPKSEFDGPEYQHSLDFTRLTGQIERIFNVMVDKRWRTLREIEGITGDPQASISAQLRHLKKEKFGLHSLYKQRRGIRSQGLFEYSLHRNTCDCNSCEANNNGA
jgi:hypothetical protein